MNYDIIIVGSGPAGSSAAEMTAKAGLNVLLLESKKTPWRKPCGGTLTPYAVKEFNIPIDGIKGKDGFSAHRINAFRLITSLDDCLQINIPPSIVVDRAEFDHYLRKKAIRAGAKFKDETHVVDLLFKEGKICGIITKNSIRYYAKIVIDAAGVTSHLAIKAGLRGKYNPIKHLFYTSVSYIEGFQGEPDVDLFYRIDNLTPMGYVWIFPMGNNIANVGFGCSYGRLKANSMFFLNEFYKNIYFKKQFPNGYNILWKSSYPLPVCGPLGDAFTDGFMVTGDSGGFTNPATGEGIYQALWTGKCAGNWAVKAVISRNYSSDFLIGYQNECNARFSETQDFNYLF